MNKLLSKCCKAETETGGMGDFHDKDRVCTMYMQCSKCKKPCEFYKPQKRSTFKNQNQMNYLKYPKRIHNWLLQEEREKGEAYEQILLVEWLQGENFFHTSIPMSTWTTPMQCNKNKALGVNSGIPDLFLILPCKSGKNLGVFIELKKARKYGKKGQEIKNGSVTSDNQKEWIEKINECEGIGAFICYGFNEAKASVEDIIKSN